MAPHWQIERPATPDEAHKRAIAAPLDAFNEAATGDFAPDHWLALLLRDSTGATVGGLWGRAYFQWLFIELLYIPESLRGAGVGTALVRQAEAAALDWGCHGVWLDSFSFQAPDFYRRLGYSDFGELEAYPDGHRRHFLKKRLTPETV